jgi:hypothetical protein
MTRIGTSRNWRVSLKDSIKAWLSQYVWYIVIFCAVLSIAGIMRYSDGETQIGTIFFITGIVTSIVVVIVSAPSKEEVEAANLRRLQESEGQARESEETRSADEQPQSKNAQKAAAEKATDKEADKEEMPEWQARMLASQLHRAADDCIKVCDTTLNPEIYFTKYELLIETLEDMVDTEKYVEYHAGKPSELLAELSDPAVRERQVNIFLAKTGDKLKTDVSKLRSPRAQRNKIDRYFENMNKYRSYMSKANRAYVESLRQEMIAYFIADE